MSSTAPRLLVSSATRNRGRRFTSSYIRPRYCPMIPRQRSWTPPRMSTVATTDVQPATASFVKIRTANLPSLQLTPKETTFLLAAVAMGNLILGLVLGILL